MYLMLQKRQNLGEVLSVEEPDRDDLHEFLTRFDLNKKCVSLALNPWATMLRLVQS